MTILDDDIPDVGDVSLRAYVERVRAASGTAHLKREETARLAPVKDGVRAIKVETEAQADKIAADIHTRMTWMSLCAVQRMLDRAEQLERRPVLN